MREAAKSNMDMTPPLYMDKLPDGWVLVSREHFEKMAKLYEDYLCEESIKRIEAREKAGLCKYRPAEEFYSEFEAKHGIKV